VDWSVALEFILGGAAGGFFGMRAAVRLGEHKRVLNYVFSAIIFSVALYMAIRTGSALAGS
jgi:uncharacterized protein